MQLVVLVQDTLVKLLSVPLGRGAGVTDHSDPFQDSTRIWYTLVVVYETPAATQLVVLVHDTLSRLLSMVPTSGLGMTDHAVPFQDSTSVRPTAVPTAVQLIGLVQDTLSSWPELVVSCAMGRLGTAASTGMVIDTATTIESPTATKIDSDHNRKRLFPLIPSPPSQLVHWSVHCGLAWGKRPMETSRPQSSLFQTVAPQNRYGSTRF